MRARSVIRGPGWSAVLAAALLVPMLAAAQPAHATGGDGLSDGGTPAAAKELRPAVSAAAWQAGRQAFGAGVSAEEAIHAYWTPERMRAATPVEELPEYQESLRRGPDHAPPVIERRGEPLAVPPADGALTASRTPSAINPNLPYYTPTAYTSGKVFLTIGGQNGACSATIVNSTGGNTVWTAGHCIHTGGPSGSTVTNWAFVPAYDDDLANPAPYGTWTAHSVYVTPEWYYNNDWAHDMGVAIMNTRNGWNIVRYFGGQGLLVNQGTSNSINAFGYPGEAPFDGGNLMRCASNTTADAGRIRISCDMTRGASGGAWLLQWDGDWGYVNGVNSTLNAIVGPTLWWSPYFGNSALNLYQYTAPM